MPSVLSTVIKPNHNLLENATATIVEGEERGMDQIDDFSIGSRMIVLVYLGDVFKSSNSGLQRLFEI